MSYAEYDTYINTIDVVEDSMEDDTKYPVVKDGAVKKLL